MGGATVKGCTHYFSCLEAAWRGPRVKNNGTPDTQLGDNLEQ